MDEELTAHMQEPVPRCILFVDDIALVDESRDRVNENLERW